MQHKNQKFTQTISKMKTFTCQQYEKGTPWIEVKDLKIYQRH